MLVPFLTAMLTLILKNSSLIINVKVTFENLCRKYFDTSRRMTMYAKALVHPEGQTDQTKPSEGLANTVKVKRWQS